MQKAIMFTSSVDLNPIFTSVWSKSDWLVLLRLNAGFPLKRLYVVGNTEAWSNNKENNCHQFRLI